jgi:hypothetical protein
MSDLIFLLNVCFIHQSVNNKLPSVLCNLFNVARIPQIVSTRGAAMGTLLKPSVKTIRYGLNSIKFRSICNWNNIQSSVPKIALSNVTATILRFIVRNFILNT